MSPTLHSPTKKELKEMARQIADHQANITRLGEAWGQRIADQMDASDRATMARFRELLGNSEFTRNTAKAVEQLDFIKTKLAEIRMRAFIKAEKELRAEVPDLIDNETKWSKRLLSELTGEKASNFAELTDAAAQKILKNSILTNKTWAQWWTATASADIDRIANVISGGVSQGLTIDQMTRLIMGTKAGGYADGILSTNRAHARNLARTLCGGISNQAKDAFYRENGDVVKQVEWLSTLDGRTCASCAGLDRKRWETDSRHPVPGLHPSCRCVLLPVTEMTDLGEDAGRPRANSDFMADAERTYQEKYPDKDWGELSQATRQKYYHQAIHDYEDRTGKPAFTVGGGAMSFREYFGQMSEQQKRDWLGKRKYDLYRGGNLSLDKFIPPYPDRAYTVRELKAMDKASFITPDLIPPDKMKNILSGKVTITPLTGEEKKAVADYSGGDNETINSFLYEKTTGTAGKIREAKQQARIINDAIDKCILKSDITLYRGMWEEEMLGAIKLGIKHIDAKGIQSCSIDLSVAHRHARTYPEQSVIYKITVPKGSHAMPVNDAAGSAYPAEREVLLKSGGTFEILKKPYPELENGKNTGRLIVEVIYYER